MLRPRVITARDAEVLGRRAESVEDGYVTKIVKYIPAESLAAYAAAAGIIAAAAGDLPARTWYWIAAGFLFPFTFLWVLFGAAGKREGLPLPYYQAIVSAIAFAAWVFVIDGVTLVGPTWNGAYGSLLALGVTLVVPLLERVFVRPRK